MNRSRILALVAYENSLIYSCGGNLYKFCRESSKLSKLQIFSQGQIIHGISSIQRDLAIVWSGKSVCLVDLKLWKRGKESRSSHWILHCAFSNANSESIMCFTNRNYFLFLEGDSRIYTYRLDGMITAVCSFGVGFAYANVDGEICVIEGQKERFFSAGSFPLSLWMNDEWLVCCCGNGKILVWSLAIEEDFNDNALEEKLFLSSQAKTFTGHVNRPWKAFVSPLGFLISIGEDCSIRKWSLQNQKQYSISQLEGVGNVFSVTCIGKSVFVGCFDGTIREIAFETEQIISSRWKAKVGSFTLMISWKEHEFLPNEALSKYCLMEHDPMDGKKIWATDLLGNCYLLQPGSCELWNGFSLSPAKVHKIFRGKERLYFWSLSHCNWLFNPVDGTKICISNSSCNQQIQITSICELPNGSSSIVVGTRDGKLILRNNNNNNNDDLEIILSKDAISSLTYDSERKLLWAASKDGFVYSLEFSEAHGQLKMKNQFAFEFAAQGGIEWIEIWNSGLLIGNFYAKRMQISWFSPRETLILASWDCGGGHRPWKIYLQEQILHFGYLRKGEVIWNQLDLVGEIPLYLSHCKGHCKTVRTMIVCGDDYLASAGDDGVIMLWKIGECLEFVTRKVHTSTINALHWDCKEEMLYSAGGNGEIVAWKMIIDNGGHEIARNVVELKFHKKCAFLPCIDLDLRVMALSGTESGDDLWVSYSNGELYVFQKQEFKVVRSYIPKWKNSFVTCIATEGNRVFTGHSNGKVCLLEDESSNGDFKVLWAHKGSVTKLLIHQGKLYSCGYDGTVLMEDNGHLIDSSLLSMNGLCAFGNEVVWIDAGGRVIREDHDLGKKKENGISFIGDICGIVEFHEKIVCYGGGGIEFLEIEVNE